jgi:nicotinamide-nucleotide amidase
MRELLPIAERVGALLKSRNEKVVAAESSAGGLINAALLAVPGASGWCLGGAVIYTRTARAVLAGITDEMMRGMTASTEAYALLKARALRERFRADWCIAETGTAGPTGSRYGYAAGHACFAVVGPVERSATLETGSADRLANMHAFASAALDLLADAVAAAGAK